MTQRFAPMCLWCKHRTDGIENTDELGPIPSTPTCKAFPNGIPDKIFFEIGDHRKEWPGDNGIQFEASDEELPEYMQWQPYK